MRKPKSYLYFLSVLQIDKMKVVEFRRHYMEYKDLFRLRCQI